MPVRKTDRPPSRPAATPRGRPRSLVSEQAILNATLRILSTEGYAALTLDRVAAEAHASKATIYRRWKTKEHLVLAVFSQLPPVVPEEGRNLEEDLLSLFSQSARFMQDSPLKSVLPSLAAECVRNPALSSALILVNEQRRAPPRLVFQRAIRRGELPADTDIELAIDVIQGAVAIRLYFLLDTLSETWIRRLVRLVIAGLRAQKS